MSFYDIPTNKKDTGGRWLDRVSREPGCGVLPLSGDKVQTASPSGATVISAASGPSIGVNAGAVNREFLALPDQILKYAVRALANLAAFAAVAGVLHLLIGVRG